MRNSVKLLSAALLSLAITGCVLTPRSQQQTAYYDLAIPQPDTTVNFLKIAAVNNDTPAQSRMFFRAKNNRIEQDSLNCWIQPPERILQRYLTQKFQQTVQTDSANTVAVRCSINAFEFDITRSEAFLSLKCTFIKNSLRKDELLTVREKLTGRKPAELAAAMNKAVENLAGKLATAAKNFNR